jgi:hypothetical protein
MPFAFKEPQRPKPWRQYRWRTRNPLFLPFLYVQWLSELSAFFLGKWVFLEVLEYLGTLSILIGVIFYFAGSHDRREQKHFQAWQVINTAQGKGGNGGRIDALQDLNSDGIPLVAVDLSGGAYLRFINLTGANLSRANIPGADARNANLHDTDLRDADLHSSNFRDAAITGADLTGADLSETDLTDADFRRSILDDADFRNADLTGINWTDIQSIQLANIYHVQNAPDGFRAWALAHGAVEIANDADWTKAIAAAQSKR